MRYGIPNFKLEKHLIDRRLAQMEAEGVKFVTNAHVGVNLDVAQLRKDFDAIVLAGGSEASRDLKVPGRELKGIHFAMEFLPQQTKRVLGDTVPAGAYQFWRPERKWSSSEAAIPEPIVSAPVCVRERQASGSLRSCPSRRRRAPR